jgi:hypothetical protein
MLHLNKNVLGGDQIGKVCFAEFVVPKRIKKMRTSSSKSRRENCKFIISQWWRRRDSQEINVSELALR